MRYARLHFFGANGFSEAEWEALALLHALASQPDPAAAYLEMGVAGTAYSVMQAADDRHWGDNADGSQSLGRLRVRFPRAYWDQVQLTARQFNVDPYLILALSRQESTYRPSLTSNAGAKGLMQVMPKTANWLVKVDEKVDRRDAANLANPKHSLLVGTAYLGRMLDRYNGNIAYALAAYNAGPNNCDKWRKAAANDDVTEFIEDIPFSETRRYVKRVLGFYATYYSIYPDGLAPPGAVIDK